MNLKLTKRNQAFVINGLSGSGKTENTKYIIDFLSGVFEAQNTTNSNQILEILGNARTHLNENISRFCKYIQVFEF